MTDTWKPPAERPDGFECLAFHRGKWRHVKWQGHLPGWSLGYGSAFIMDGDRAFAPLPENTPEHDFFAWRDRS